MIRTLAVGAGAGGVYALMAAMGVATLPAGALVGLVSTLVGLGATVIDLIDYIGHNQGVYFYVRLVPLAVLVWHN